jgi:hypothetical protein
MRCRSPRISQPFSPLSVSYQVPFADKFVASGDLCGGKTSAFVAPVSDADVVYHRIVEQHDVLKTNLMYLSAFRGRFPGCSCRNQDLSFISSQNGAQ